MSLPPPLPHWELLTCKIMFALWNPEDVRYLRSCMQEHCKEFTSWAEKIPWSRVRVCARTWVSDALTVLGPANEHLFQLGPWQESWPFLLQIYPHLPTLGDLCTCVSWAHSHQQPIQCWWSLRICPPMHVLMQFYVQTLCVYLGNWDPQEVETGLELSLWTEGASQLAQW